jgi:hypothetical protein
LKLSVFLLSRGAFFGSARAASILPSRPPILAAAAVGRNYAPGRRAVISCVPTFSIARDDAYFGVRDAGCFKVPYRLLRCAVVVEKARNNRYHVCLSWGFFFWRLKLFRYHVSLEIERDVDLLPILLGLPPPHAAIVLLQATHVGKIVSFNARSSLSLGLQQERRGCW